MISLAEEAALGSTRVLTVPVPGARLHCEMLGSGPPVLLIAGAAADAGALAGLAARLSPRYLTVTYDMRGLSRSVVEGPAEDTGIAVLADDAHRILGAVGSAPAMVFGTSGGALVGLELAARHPEQLRTVIAHEPPAMALLPGSAHWQDFLDELELVRRDYGAGAAMGCFLDGIEAVGGPRSFVRGLARRRPGKSDTSWMSARARALMRSPQANMEHFFSYQIRGASSYLPDFDALGDVRDRLVIGVGTASAGQVSHEASLEVAGRLGLEAVEFPGGHQGYLTQPARFAGVVDRLLSLG